MQINLHRRALFGSTCALALLTGVPASAATFEFLTEGLFTGNSVAQSGTYEVRVGGGDGGASYGGAGGTGAWLSGTIYLSAGATFNVLVGGNGLAGTFVAAGGGGGGLSYFSSGPLLAVAGGGGGASYNESGASGYGRGLPGGSGAGGSAGAGDYPGSGGAGFAGDGQNGYDSTGGKSAAGGWAGGSGWRDADGGFGGGGGGDYGGGGGGGYTGGSGGYSGYFYTDPSTAGQGGTSFVTSAYLGTFSVLTGASRTSTISGGYVTLDLVRAATSDVPLPGAGGLMGLALAGLIARARRRQA